MAAPFRSDRYARHLNQNELAARWGISPKTAERWRWSGHGPAYIKVGHRVAYKLEDIEAYEAEQRRVPAGTAEAEGAL
ncbi:helix-turn-helix transcriptional regulator [Muricoccus radiodurans]|uniref:helix-turn-helix transcriptional regulator n=1 Tax=Muricoccus radiodurans TaxID=2231721 RepID=UPI003CFBAC23